VLGSGKKGEVLMGAAVVDVEDVTTVIEVAFVVELGTSEWEDDDACMVCLAEKEWPAPLATITSTLKLAEKVPWYPLDLAGGGKGAVKPCSQERGKR
jgi:hypothetical protein